MTRHVAIFLLMLSAFLSAVTAAHAEMPGNPYGQNWRCAAIEGHWNCTEILNANTSIYNNELTPREKRALVGPALGWIPDNSNSNKTVCGGHYYVADFPHRDQEAALDKSPSKVLSNTKNYTVGGNVELKGDVEIIQPGRRVYADHLLLSPDPKSPTHPEKIYASGNVRLRQPGQLVLGKELHANLYTHKATLKDVYYLLKVRPEWSSDIDFGKLDNFTGYAHGHASSAVQESKNQYVFHDATYTTSPPGDDAWLLSASKITLDKKSGRGVALNSVLRVARVPVFYFPYFSFPLNDKRQSGFLYGSVGTSSKSGIMFSAPYYFNLAPNYDDTLTPNYLTQRGMLLDNQFRYLTTSSKGILQTDILPYDKKADKTRWLLSYNQQTQFNSVWSMGLLYNDVSDSQYFDDLENNSVKTANLTYLDRHASLAADTEHWQFSGILRDYKIVNQSLLTPNRPYDTLPALKLNGQFPAFKGPFDFKLNSSFVNFEKEPAANEARPVQGQRANLKPMLTMPLTRRYGYFTPGLGFEGTAYQLQDASINGFSKNTPTRSLPIAKVDTALHFDRTFVILGKRYTQSLTPRLHYLYVPYRSQHNIPIFDSSVIQFGYSQLFADNRFNGLDRMGDANRLSYALGTNVDDNKGRRVLSLNIGQIAYFHDRRVSICRTADCIVNENPDYQHGFSDIAANGFVALSPHLSLTGDLTYSTYRKVLDTQDYQLHYWPDSAHLFNLGFNSNRTDYALLSTQDLLSGVKPPLLAQVTTSFLWKLTPVWRLIGSWNYATNKKRTVSSYAGFEYSPCSWAIRFVWRKFLVTDNVNNPDSLSGSSTTGVLLQFQLKGLGNLGSTKIQYLAKQIPGYNPAKSGF